MSVTHRQLLALLASILTASAVGAAGGAGTPQESRESHPGRAEYVEMGCYQCHDYEGQGARATGPHLAPEPLPFEMFSEWVRRPPEVSSLPVFSEK